MRFLSTRVHGVLDYLMGVLLIGVPWLLGFANNGPETWIPVTLGISVIVYSLMTNYEWGAIRVIPMSVHLWLDALSGIFLAASPWLFNFDERIYMPHLVAGLFEFVAAMITVNRYADNLSNVNDRIHAGTYTRTSSTDTNTRTDTNLNRDMNRDRGVGQS